MLCGTVRVYLPQSESFVPPVQAPAAVQPQSSDVPTRHTTHMHPKYLLTVWLRSDDG